MPTIPSIRTSVENQSVLVLDEHAKNGVFRRDARGRLIAYTGGFSVVFPYKTTGGEKWAFRCWHSDMGNIKKRYQTISEAIKKAKLDFLCDFLYVDNGINVEGKIYPITRMKWIDGITIKDYICQNKDSKEVLFSLADKFLKMTQALHSQSLAHGDLQHGNILIDKNHQLYLVDYDSFYCPKLKGEADIVTGLPDYQHPARSRNKSVSEKLDYFSELIIYLSILAIAENPSLVEKYKVEDADRLLFAKEDFVDLQHSEIYGDIQAIGKNSLNDLLEILVAYLDCSSIDKLFPFDIKLLEKEISFTTSTKKAVRNSQKVEIKWNVPNKVEVTEVIIKKGKNSDFEKCKETGTIITTLSESDTFELHITIKGGHKIRKQISIDVFDECVIDFKADKYYIFPTVPVRLSWNVKHAKKVWLDGKEVNDFGGRIIEPKKSTTCILSAEDEFGKKEKRIEIGMLPIPQVKSLLIPTPDLINNLSITITQPRFNVSVPFPNIEIETIKTEIPKVPSFTEKGLNVELSPPLPKFNLKRVIKNIYNHIIGK